MFEINFMYARFLFYGIVFFIALIFIEMYLLKKVRNRSTHVNEGIASLSSGLTNILKDVLGIAVLIWTYDFLLEHLSIGTLPFSWWTAIILFIVMDFTGYWEHRLEHTFNVFWNRHRMHHSGEFFNVASALRQGISSIISFNPIFYIPIALIGIPVEIIAIVAPIHKFSQFWYHTELIYKMGVLEKIIVTPSHHRVHHSMNKTYHDKNFSQIFIIWDKLFGTFQEELESEKPVFGVTRPTRSFNPFFINYHHMLRLYRDAWFTKNWKDKLTLWFKPTGWRPDDVKKRFPIKSVKDVHAYAEKLRFNPKHSFLSSVWIMLQFVITSALTLYLFYRVVEIDNSPAIFESLGFVSNALVFGLFCLLSVNSYTLYMDKNKFHWLADGVKLAFALVIIFTTKDFFLINTIVPFGTNIIIFYLAFTFITSVVSSYFFSADESIIDSFEEKEAVGILVSS